MSGDGRRAGLTDAERVELRETRKRSSWPPVSFRVLTELVEKEQVVAEPAVGGPADGLSTEHPPRSQHLHDTTNEQ